MGNKGGFMSEQEKQESKSPKTELSCSFCGKSSKFAHRLISGPNNVFICDECVHVCAAIVYAEGDRQWISTAGNYKDNSPSKTKMTRKRTKATPEQIDALIKKYASNEAVLKILYVGPCNTLLFAEEALHYGITLNEFTINSHHPVTIPECRDYNSISNDLYSFKTHMDIAKKIIRNFINNNPQYFSLVTKTKYAVSDEFIYDVLETNKEMGYDHDLDITSVLRFITDLEIFNKISKEFYLTYATNETLEKIKRSYWKKGKPFSTKFTNKLTPLVGGKLC
jgi:hypothetical protein